MQSIKLPMTDAQMRKLGKGGAIRVNPASKCTAYEMYCEPKKCRRMEKMMTKGQGFQMKFSPEEMEENVEVEGGRINFKKIGKTLRSTAKAVGKFYREKIRPVVGPEIRKAVETAIEKGIPLAADALAMVTGQPEILAASQPAIKKGAKKAAKVGTEALSKLTGAFGMAKPKKTKAAPKKKKSVTQQIYAMENPKPMPSSRAQLQDNYSPFLNPKHPAMNPMLPMPDNSLPIIPGKMGGRGLYMQGSGLFAGSGMMMSGSPMDAVLPQIDNSTYY